MSRHLTILPNISCQIYQKQAIKQTLPRQVQGRACQNQQCTRTNSPRKETLLRALETNPTSFGTRHVSSMRVIPRWDIQGGSRVGVGPIVSSSTRIRTLSQLPTSRCSSLHKCVGFPSRTSSPHHYLLHLFTMQGPTKLQRSRGRILAIPLPCSLKGVSFPQTKEAPHMG